MKKLAKEQFAQLHTELVQSFSRPELEQLARMGLDQNLDTIAGGDTTPSIVFNLIHWAERSDNIGLLVHSALAARPSNVVFKALAEYDKRGVLSGDHVNKFNGTAGSTLGNDAVDRFGVHDFWPQGRSGWRRDMQNREIILNEMMRRTEERRRQALFNAVCIDLRLKPQSYQVRSVRHIGNALPGDAEELSIVSAYENAHGSLLILGEPGAGKTVQLYELAAELSRRALAEMDAIAGLAKELEPIEPIPIIINLSSWSERQLPFIDRASTEIGRVHQIPRKFARCLIERDSLVLLLDGLDEVQEQCRNDCVKEINRFCAERNIAIAPCVVCCRQHEY